MRSVAGAGGRTVRTGVAVLALALSMLTQAPAARAATLGPDQLPNLVPLSARELSIGLADGSSVFDPTYAIRFSTSMANRGEYAFDLIGIPKDVERQRASAMQCVYFQVSQCVERREVGELVWHSGDHNHYHLEDFALYELRRLLEDGTPDWSEEGLVGGGDKVSFCVVNYERDPGSGSAASGNPMYSAATCQLYTQGISPGWMDTYGSYLSGQQIVLTDAITDGRYALLITVNPAGRIAESNLDDNQSVRKVEVYSNRTRIRIVP